MPSSSFYAGGDNYSTATATSNDQPGSTTPSKAPSSFFQSGGEYAALQDGPTLATQMQAYLASTQASAAAAATSASNASASASAAAASASVAAAGVSAFAATTTPLIDGTAAVGTSTNWAHEDHRHPTDTTRAPVANPNFTGTVSVSGNQFLSSSGNYNAIQDQAGNTAIFLGGSGDTANYYRNTLHYFQSIGGTTPYGTWGSGALALNTPLTVIGGSASVTGSDANFSAGGNRGFVDQVGGNARIGSLNGGGAGNGLQVVVNGSTALSFTSGGVGSFVSTPTAPTATAGDNSTKLATTAFVLANGTSLGSTTPVMDGTGAAGVATVAARADHVHPTDTSRASLATNSFSGAQTISNTTDATGVGTGSLISSGGASFSKAIVAGTTVTAGTSLVPKATSTAAWGLDFSAAPQLTVPANSSVALAVGSGLVMLTDGTFSGQTGMYLIGGSLTSAASKLAGGSHYDAPTVTPTAGNYSVGFDGTNWRVYNGSTTTAISFYIGLIRIRNTV